MVKRDEQALVKAMKWRCGSYSPIYKNYEWGFMNRSSRRALMEELTVVCVLQDVIEEVVWIFIVEERPWY